MKIKRRAVVIVFAMALFVVFCFFIGAATKPDVVKILLKTPLYKEPSFSAEKVIPEIKQNETVEAIGQPTVDEDGLQWIKIRYNAHYEGYVPYSYLYYTVENDGYEVYVAKITGKNSSDDVKLFKYYDTNEEPAKILHDGQKVSVIVDREEAYGDYLKVIYDGETYFVKAENVTTGLTYNQKLALIISGGLVGGGLGLAFVIILLIRKNKASAKHK